MIMRIVLLVMVASLAGACDMEEPVGEPEAVSLSAPLGEVELSWSALEPEGEAESEAEPEVEPISFYPICVDHYVCCQESALRHERDAPNRSRCQSCSMRCHDKNDMRGRWPNTTHAGKDCRWWRKQYGTPKGECKESAA
jgi:hypothetical protein